MQVSLLQLLGSKTLTGGPQGFTQGESDSFATFINPDPTSGSIKPPKVTSGAAQTLTSKVGDGVSGEFGTKPFKNLIDGTDLASDVQTDVDAIVPNSGLVNFERDFRYSGPSLTRLAAFGELDLAINTTDGSVQPSNSLTVEVPDVIAGITSASPLNTSLPSSFSVSLSAPSLPFERTSIASSSTPNTAVPPAQSIKVVDVQADTLSDIGSGTVASSFFTATAQSTEPSVGDSGVAVFVSQESNTAPLSIVTGIDSGRLSIVPTSSGDRPIDTRVNGIFGTVSELDLSIKPETSAITLITSNVDNFTASIPLNNKADVQTVPNSLVSTFIGVLLNSGSNRSPSVIGASDQNPISGNIAADLEPVSKPTGSTPIQKPQAVELVRSNSSNSEQVQVSTVKSAPTVSIQSPVLAQSAPPADVAESLTPSPDLSIIVDALQRVDDTNSVQKPVSDIESKSISQPVLASSVSSTPLTTSIAGRADQQTSPQLETRPAHAVLSDFINDAETEGETVTVANNSTVGPAQNVASAITAKGQTENTASNPSILSSNVAATQAAIKTSGFKSDTISSDGPSFTGLNSEQAGSSEEWSHPALKPTDGLKPEASIATGQNSVSSSQTTPPTSPSPSSANASPSSAQPTQAGLQHQTAQQSTPADLLASEMGSELDLSLLSDIDVDGFKPADLKAVETTSQTVNRQTAMTQLPAMVSRIGEQILERFTGRSSVFEIRLDPPELGKVDARIEVGNDGKILAVISARDPSVVEALMRGAKTLENALTQAGLTLGEKGVQVELDQRQPSGKGGGQNNETQQESYQQNAATNPHEDDVLEQMSRMPRTEAWSRSRLDVMA